MADSDLYTDFDPNDPRYNPDASPDASSYAQGFLSDDIIFGGLFGSLIKTPAEKAAEAKAKAAQDAAKSEFALRKARAEKNDAIAQGVETSMFGESYDQILARLMAERDAERGGGSQPQPAATPAVNPATVAGPASGVPAPAGYEAVWNGSGFDMVPVAAPAAPTAQPQSQPQPTGPATDEGETIEGRTKSGRRVAFDAPPPDNRKVLEERARAIFEEQQKQTLPGQLDAALSERQAASDELVGALGGIGRVGFGTDEGWYTPESAARRSGETRAQQKAGQDKLWQQTDVRETAEERLMRELARRSMETDLRAQRETVAQNLKERGAYGSGAEMASFLGGQQELAQRRALEEMAAGANAQKRAMAALGKFSDTVARLGEQDIAEGTQVNLTNQFNAGQKKDFTVKKAAHEASENEAEARRAATVSDSRTSVAAARANKAKDVANAQMGVAGLKIGTGTQGTQLQSEGLNRMAGNFAGEQARLNKQSAEEDENYSWGAL